VFGSVVAVAFQSFFRSEMYQNNVFFKIFLTSTHQNDLKTLKIINLMQIKKNSIFFKNIFKIQKQTNPKRVEVFIIHALPFTLSTFYHRLQLFFLSMIVFQLYPLVCCF
jgi:ABC-type antimicrobial peptide transport system permease subunit